MLINYGFVKCVRRLLEHNPGHLCIIWHNPLSLHRLTVQTCAALQTLSIVSRLVLRSKNRYNGASGFAQRKPLQRLVWFCATKTVTTARLRVTKI